MDTNGIFEILSALCSARGVSGDETDVCICAADMLRGVADSISVADGSVTAHFAGGEGKPKFTLDAHIDQIGFIVTSLEKGGFLRVSPCGGIDDRLLAGLPVRIYGREVVSGVICSVPPHLVHGDEKVIPANECRIDTGMSLEKLSRLVSKGDSVGFYAPPQMLSGTRVTSGALDNRAGAAALLYALKMLRGRETAFDITAVFTAQEELGCRGAVTAAYSTEAEFALSFDVSFALSPGEDESACGVLGKGPMIGFAPVLDRKMSMSLCKLAQEYNIPFQREIMSGQTSTNADKFSISRGGIRTALISVPLRYMHSPAEIIDIDDIDASARLLCKFLINGLKEI